MELERRKEAWDFARELRALRESTARGRTEELQALRRNNEEVERCVLRRQMDESAALQEKGLSVALTCPPALSTMAVLRWCTWLAVSAVLAAESAEKVRVELFAEAGCPFCRAAIAGPVTARRPATKPSWCKRKQPRSIQACPTSW
eukprot:g31749.t1